jgi:hypothetical protein
MSAPTYTFVDFPAQRFIDTDVAAVVASWLTWDWGERPTTRPDGRPFWLTPIEQEAALATPSEQQNEPEDTRA